MSDPQTPTGAGTRSRGVKITLALSLALNLLIAGLVAGALLGNEPRGGGGPGGDRAGLRSLGLGPFALALDREDRAALRARIAVAPQGRNRAEIGAAMRDFRAVLRTEPFDRAAAEAALARARDGATALQARGHAALLDHVAGMDPAERAALDTRLDRALRRLGPRGP